MNCLLFVVDAFVLVRCRKLICEFLLKSIELSVDLYFECAHILHDFICDPVNSVKSDIQSIAAFFDYKFASFEFLKRHNLLPASGVTYIPKAQLTFAELLKIRTQGSLNTKNFEANNLLEETRKYFIFEHVRVKVFKKLWLVDYLKKIYKSWFRYLYSKIERL